ncbi:MAG: hypothetical protein R2784_18785 [Saprospiraceae bacterium]
MDANQIKGQKEDNNPLKRQPSFPEIGFSSYQVYQLLQSNSSQITSGLIKVNFYYQGFNSTFFILFERYFRQICG